MKVSFPLGSLTDYDSPEEIKTAITRQLVKWFGTLPTYKVEAISVSASWLLWIRLKVKSGKLDYPETIV